jgi:TPR repeat protein
MRREYVFAFGGLGAVAFGVVFLAPARRSLAEAPCSPEQPAICQRTCRAGNQQSCAVLGLLLVRGQGHEQDVDEGARLLRAACEAGNALGCGGMGSLHAAGLGVPKDLQKSQALFAKACQGGDMLSCDGLGGLHLSGELGRPDPDNAAHWYEKSCTLGSVRGCLSLGALLEDGVKSVNPASWNVVDLFTLACNARLALGCLFLADHFEAGRGVKADRKRAKELRASACSLGLRRACEGGHPQR